MNSLSFVSAGRSTTGHGSPARKSEHRSRQGSCRFEGLRAAELVSPGCWWTRGDDVKRAKFIWATWSVWVLYLCLSVGRQACLLFPTVISRLVSRANPTLTFNQRSLAAMITWTICFVFVRDASTTAAQVPGREVAAHLHAGDGGLAQRRRRGAARPRPGTETRGAGAAPLLPGVEGATSEVYPHASGVWHPAFTQANSRCVHRWAVIAPSEGTPPPLSP